MRRIASAAFVSSPGALALALLLCAATALAQADLNAGKNTRPAPAFHHVDANGDGRVTLDEVLAYAKQKNVEAKPFRLADVDLNGDGILTQEELNKAGVKGLGNEGSINARELDMHGDGYVSQDDLDEYFARKHKTAYVRADADKDNALRPSEFTLFHF